MSIISMVIHGLVLTVSVDFDSRSWITMVDHLIPCSPSLIMVTRGVIIGVLIHNTIISYAYFVPYLSHYTQKHWINTAKATKCNLH